MLAPRVEELEQHQRVNNLEKKGQLGELIDVTTNSSGRHLQATYKEGKEKKVESKQTLRYVPFSAEQALVSC